MSFNCLRLQAAAVLLAAIASPALAAEYFVNSLLDDGSSGTLRDAITQANASGEASSIYFNVGGTLNLMDALPTIGQTISIYGTGHSVTLDGGGSYRPFIVAGGNLTLDTMTIQNSTAGSSYGGAVAVDTGSHLTARNMTFSNNSAVYGGAIYATSSTSSVTIENSIFSQNNATEAGGAYLTFYGETTITNSQFNNNQAFQGGAVVSYFTGGDLTVQDSSFTGNRANFDDPDNPSQGYGIAGALWSHGAKQANIDNTTFDGNHSDDYGGAIMITTSHLNLTNSTVSNNTGTEGAAIWATSSNAVITVQDSQITDNSGERTGGAIYLEHGTLVIERSTLDGNQVLNTATATGGAVYTANGDVTISQSTISNNHADGHGGGLSFSQGSDATLQNVTITGNTANSNGGGISIGTDTLVQIINATIAYNEAGTGGGGVGGTGLTLGNTILANNTAATAGTNNLANSAATSLGYNLLDDDGLTDALASDLLNAIADLLALADNGGPTLTISLGDLSEALFNGHTDLTVDQRGYARLGGATTIGALEIPEPSTAALLGGAALLLGRRRSSRRAKNFGNHAKPNGVELV